MLSIVTRKSRWEWLCGCVAFDLCNEVFMHVVVSFLSLSLPFTSLLRVACSVGVISPKTGSWVRARLQYWDARTGNDIDPRLMCHSSESKFLPHSQCSLYSNSKFRLLVPAKTAMIAQPLNSHKTTLATTTSTTKLCHCHQQAWIRITPTTVGVDRSRHH